MNPYQVVKDLESALCSYTGAPYAVTTTSCTMALLLACRWFLKDMNGIYEDDPYDRTEVNIPKYTYVSVPMSILHARGRVSFRDEEWSGAYQLKPLPVWDSARRFTSGMYFGEHFHDKQDMVCVSFHASKILCDTQGGAILHSNAEADKWFRKARFDGRTEGVAPKDDTFDVLGYHCYMSPDVAARLLLKLSVLPAHNEDLPNDDYPDLSKMEIFK